MHSPRLFKPGCSNCLKTPKARTLLRRLHAPLDPPMLLTTLTLPHQSTDFCRPSHFSPSHRISAPFFHQNSSLASKRQILCLSSLAHASLPCSQASLAHLLCSLSAQCVLQLSVTCSTRFFSILPRDLSGLLCLIRLRLSVFLKSLNSLD